MYKKYKIYNSTGVCSVFPMSLWLTPHCKPYDDINVIWPPPLWFPQCKVAQNQTLVIVMWPSLSLSIFLFIIPCHCNLCSYECPQAFTNVFKKGSRWKCKTPQCVTHRIWNEFRIELFFFVYVDGFSFPPSIFYINKYDLMAVVSRRSRGVTSLTILKLLTFSFI